VAAAALALVEMAVKVMTAAKAQPTEVLALEVCW